MEEQRISFETAKLAKEKGFDIIQKYDDCSSLYRASGEAIYFHEYGLMGAGLSLGYISAPTQSLLQKWIREKHNLDIIILNDGGAEFYGYRVNIVNKNLTPVPNHIGVLCYPEEDCGMLSNYEEALEMGLKDALNLITI